MDIQLTTATGKASKKTVEVSDSAFGREYNKSLVHQVVVAYLAGGRQGTRAQKTRSDVSGGGIKPWRQKGTGRARSGTSRSPIWRTGGVTFASRNQDFSQKVNKKMYRSAMQAIVSELLRQERLLVLEDLKLDDHKTKGFKSKLDALGVNNVLVITDNSDDKNLFLAARNIPNVSVTTVSEINPVALMQHEKVLTTSSAVQKIAEALS